MCYIAIPGAGATFRLVHCNLLPTTLVVRVQRSAWYVYVFVQCVYVFVETITFELNDLPPWYLKCWFTLSRLSLKVKIHGHCRKSGWCNLKWWFSSETVNNNTSWQWHLATSFVPEDWTYFHSKMLTDRTCAWLHCVSKKRPTFKLSLTLSNLNRFSKFLHCWKAYEICYKSLMTILTLP